MPGSEYYDEDKNGTKKEDVVKPEFKFDTAEDFGFSSMELSAVRALPEVTGDLKDNIGKAVTEQSKADARTKDMFNAIMPLLDNLLKDSDKNPYINWPNRAEKIQAFKQKLIAIRDRN